MPRVSPCDPQAHTCTVPTDCRLSEGQNGKIWITMRCVNSAPWPESLSLTATCWLQRCSCQYTVSEPCHFLKPGLNRGGRPAFWRTLKPMGLYFWTITVWNVSPSEWSNADLKKQGLKQEIQGKWHPVMQGSTIQSHVFNSYRTTNHLQAVCGLLLIQWPSRHGGLYSNKQRYWEKAIQSAYDNLMLSEIINIIPTHQRNHEKKKTGKKYDGNHLVNEFNCSWMCCQSWVLAVTWTFNPVFN